MARFVTAGIYSGLLNALMEGGAARLEEFELAEARDQQVDTGDDLILRDQVADAGEGEIPAPQLPEREEETKSSRE